MMVNLRGRYTAISVVLALWSCGILHTASPQERTGTRTPSGPSGPSNSSQILRDVGYEPRRHHLPPPPPRPGSARYVSRLRSPRVRSRGVVGGHLAHLLLSRSDQVAYGEPPAAAAAAASRYQYINYSILSTEPPPPPAAPVPVPVRPQQRSCPPPPRCPVPAASRTSDSQRFPSRPNVRSSMTPPPAPSIYQIFLDKFLRRVRTDGVEEVVANPLGTVTEVWIEVGLEMLIVSVDPTLEEPLRSAYKYLYERNENDIRRNVAIQSKEAMEKGCVCKCDPNPMIRECEEQVLEEYKPIQIKERTTGQVYDVVQLPEKNINQTIKNSKMCKSGGSRCNLGYGICTTIYCSASLLVHKDGEFKTLQFPYPSCCACIGI